MGRRVELKIEGRGYWEGRERSEEEEKKRVLEEEEIEDWKGNRKGRRRV
jgi:hypothetical protein